MKKRRHKRDKKLWETPNLVRVTQEIVRNCSCIAARAVLQEQSCKSRSFRKRSSAEQFFSLDSGSFHGVWEHFTPTCKMNVSSSIGCSSEDSRLPHHSHLTPRALSAWWVSTTEGILSRLRTSRDVTVGAHKKYTYTHGRKNVFCPVRTCTSCSNIIRGIKLRVFSIQFPPPSKLTDSRFVSGPIMPSHSSLTHLRELT